MLLSLQFLKKKYERLLKQFIKSFIKINLIKINVISISYKCLEQHKVKLNSETKSIY